MCIRGLCFIFRTQYHNVIHCHCNIRLKIPPTPKAVTITITTADDKLGKKIEPGAPKVSARFKALRSLAENGITTGVTMMPVLPFLEDDLDNIRQIVFRAHQAGAQYIIPAFGMTLRDRQREYYFQKLDLLFPGLKEKYRRKFSFQYQASANNSKKLRHNFQQWCQESGIATRMPQYYPPQVHQMPLFATSQQIR